MRILQIGKFFPPYYYGGIETFSNNLHKALKDRKIDIDFIGCLPKSYDSDIQVDEHIYLCKTDYDIFSTQFSKSFVKKYKEIRNDYDLIFINLPHPFANLILWLFPPKKNTKIVLYWHSDIIKQKIILFFYRPLLKWLIKKSAIVTAPTEVHLNESDFVKFFRNKSKVLPFILDNDISKDDYIGTSTGKKIVFACGRLTHYKGFDVLINAAKYITDNVEIHISGIGQLKEELENQIKILGLQNKVKLLGRLSDEELKNEYKNCYLFCFPSSNRAEMMGFVQYEALSHSKPIVSTDIPRSGAPTLNVQGVSGYKVPVGDYMALADKINYLVENEDEYNRLCEGANSLAKKYFDKNIVTEYIECFRHLITNTNN